MSERVPTTGISRSDSDHIYVRDKDLCTELMGHLSFTQMLLFHLLKAPPTALQTSIVDAVLVTIMEHGLTPSAIAARETLLGAPESLQGAVAAGLLGVGNRFAGTAGDCATLLAEIVAAAPQDRVATADAIVARFRATNTPVPGYGHPIHKNGDPRVARLVEIARNAGAKGDYIAAMHTLGAAVDRGSGRHVVINASAGMGAVLAEAGLPPVIMRGIALIARSAGLIGHLLEEMENPAGGFIWRLVEESIPYRSNTRP
jgi:citrate synthase